MQALPNNFPTVIELAGDLPTLTVGVIGFRHLSTSAHVQT